MQISLSLLCFVARAVTKSLERSGQTRFKLQLAGTHWSLTLALKPPSTARVRTKSRRLVSDARTLQDGLSDISPGLGGEEPHFILTETGKEWLASHEDETGQDTKRDLA